MPQPELAGDLGVARYGCEQAELASLSRVGRFLNSILDLDELLRAILEEALDAVGAMRGFVALIDRASGELEVRFTAGTGWDASTARRRIKVSEEPGSGITGYVAATGLPYVCGDVTVDRYYLHYFDDIRSEVVVPLLDRNGHPIGVLNIESERVNAFTRRDQQLLVALASQASIAITVADYRVRERALIQLGQELVAITDAEQMMQRVVSITAEMLHADDCSVFQLNETGDHLILRASGGLLSPRVGEQAYPLGAGLTGWVAAQGQAVRVGDVRQDPRWRGLLLELPPEEIASLLAVPIRSHEGVLGVLRVVCRKRPSPSYRDEFTAEDEALLTTLAGQVGASLVQRRLIERLVHTERLAAWGEMSARSAHMIGNKVFALKGHLNELVHVLQQPEAGLDLIHSLVGDMREGLFRLEEILGEFREFVMATHLTRIEHAVNELVQLAVVEAFPKQSAISLRLELAPDLPPVLADASKLRRALGELVENAVNHQSGGGELRVTTGSWTKADAARFAGWPAALRAVEEALAHRPAVRIEFVDHGPGIPAEDKAHVFHPFFTTRSKGMGLGLSIVKGIIDAHGGAIREVGHSGAGAHFLIVLPAVEPKDGQGDKVTR
jgi:GAF domain-containing protein